MIKLSMNERLVPSSSGDGDEYVELSIFMGEDADHMQLTGTLRLRVGEWQLFGAAILLGAAQTRGHLEVMPKERTHIARGEQTLCGVEEYPPSWSPGVEKPSSKLRVPSSEAEKATCISCLLTYRDRVREGKSI